MGIGKIGATIGKEIIAWTRTSGCNSLLATRPIKINTCGLKYVHKLEKDILEVSNKAVYNKIKKSITT